MTIINQPMQLGQYQGEKPSGSKGKNKKAPSYNSGKTGQAPSYNSGKKGQAPSYGGGNADQGYFAQSLDLDQAAAAKREGGYNRDPRQDNRFNALSQQDQQKYYDGGMNNSFSRAMAKNKEYELQRDTKSNADLENRRTRPGTEGDQTIVADNFVDAGGGITQPKPLEMKGTIPQGQDYVGDNGQTRTNMGELSNDEWLKKMNIAQPSADETSLRTDIESAAPVDGDPVESRIQDVMQRQGKTREEAEAQNASAIQQGSDFNNDGAVSNKEWSQFQSNAEQAPAEQAPQNNFGSGFQDFINQPQVQGIINQASSKKSSSPPQYGGGMMGGRQGGMMGGGSYGSYGGGYRPDRPQYQGQQYGGGGGYSTGNYGAPRGYTPQQRQSLPGNMAPEDRYPDPAMDNSGYNGYGQQYRYDPRFNVPPF